MKRPFTFIFLLLFSKMAVGGNGMPANKNIFGKSTSLPVASFRIIFGLKDAKPRSWNGRVVLSRDQRLEIEADRFRDHQYEAKGWKKGIVSIKLDDSEFPNDYLPGGTSWVCSTRESPLHGPTTEWHDYGQLDSVFGNQTLQTIMMQPSVLLHLKCNCLLEPLDIKTDGGEFSFVPQDLIRKRVAYFLDGSVRVEVVPAVQHIGAGRLGQQDFPSILSSPSGKLWMAWQEYDGAADQLLVQNKSGEHWGQASVLASNADIFRTALAEDAKNRIWLTWSMQVNDRWDVYGRVFDGKNWSKQERLTKNEAGKNEYHTMVSDTKGNVWLVWQRTAGGSSQIYAKYYNGTQWSKEEQLSTGRSSAGNNWCPAVAAGPNGSIAVVWDGYASGNYDIYLKRRIGNNWKEEELVAATPGFEAHPTVAIDHSSKIWIAWDESGANWGKDVGFLLDKQATRLHESRSIGIVCFDGKNRFFPQQDIKQVLKPGQFWELPHLQLDAGGRPWLFARHLVMREPDTPLEGPIDLALFEIWATQYDGEKWTEPMYLPRSSGRNDMVPASALGPDGNIWAVWATDLRDTKSYQPHQLQVQLGRIDKTDVKLTLSLKPANLSAFVPADLHDQEQVRKIRSYKIQHAGKTYSIYRGDLHRHTDISVDGSNDGSILDAYRYARDVAALDFLGLSNHTDDIWDDYNWWHTQKMADLFQSKNHFVSFYGYERSVEYPNGHRNIFFTKRGAAPIFPIGAFEARGGYVGSAALYWYLHRNGGFSIPHTTGRTSGTDWRDNDPEVESLMEIYQGMRDSYEYPGSPRPFQLYKLPDSTKPIGRASSSPNSPSFRPLGFAWSALAKGYKFGFIASSDHISTHISYACFIAEKLSPEGLLEAIRHRRTYAATDNIILDIKYQGSDGEHLMGESFNSKTPVQVSAKIIGTGEILQIDVIKNNAIVQTYKPGQSEFKFHFADKEYKKQQGENYYYIRVIQKDGNMAWGSPVWVSYKN